PQPPAETVESKYRNKTDAAYAQHLALLKHAGEITEWWYEPFTGLRLPGRRNRYKPDFLVQHLDGSLEVKETKGWSKNLRDGITKFKTASGVHTWIARWTLVKRDGRGWLEKAA